MKTCPNCGATLSDETKYCADCGFGVDDQSQPPESFGSPSGFRVGFSGIIDSDAVRAALKKQKRAVRITMLVLTVLPLFCFLFYGAVSDKMDIGKAVVFGLIISAIFGLTSAIVAIRKKLSKSFEGVVVEKKKSIRVGDSDDRLGKSRTKCTVRFQTDEGKKIKKEVPLTVFNYLSEGERVRFLPQFPQPFEKYDKGGETLCMFCSKRVSLEEDTCPFCKNPVIK